MRPIVTCEKPSFRHLIQGLTDITVLPNHKNISKILQLKYKNYVSMLSKSFIISSKSHPLFKCSWIPLRYIDLCKEFFINECKLTNSYSDVYENPISDNSDDSDTEFYGNVFSSQNSSSNDELSTNADSALRNSNLSSVEALSFLNSKVKELNILDSFPVVKQVFIKFNTSIPSSAPVERLFSGAIQILTPRHNRLNDKHFDMLLCCRCYLQQNSLT